MRVPNLGSRRAFSSALFLTLGCLGCGDPKTVTGPSSSTGNVRVTMSTTGPAVALDPDGYTVSIDNGPGQATSTNGGSVTFSDLTPGAHFLLFGGVAINCTLDQYNHNPVQVTVTAGKTLQVARGVVCEIAGAVQITVTPSGVWLPANGYVVSIDTGPAYAIPTGGGFATIRVPMGDHRVALTGPPWNCTVADSNPVTVAVTIGAIVPVTFKVTCVAGATSGVIAFTSDRGGCPNIYAMNEDGSGVGELTNIGYCGEMANGAAWSPDGMKIAYDVTPTVWGVGRVPWIAVMNADGSQSTFIRDTLVGREEPAWSPDGTRIAGTNWGIACNPRRGCGPSSANPQIFVVSADGSGFEILASHGHTPAWSPDGTKLAFADRYNPDHTVNLIDDEIYVMNVDGTGVVNLTNSPGSDDGPAWSPDGTKIAFRSNRSGYYDLLVMNADGSGVTALTADTASEGRPAWSPDGTRIAFASDRDGDNEIYVMNADGSGVVKLTDNAGWDARPAWAP